MAPEIHITVMAERSERLIREAADYRLAKAAAPAREDGESYLARLARAARARRLSAA